MDEEDSQPVARPNRWALGALSVTGVLGLLLSVPLVFASAFMFDAPGADNPVTWSLAYGVFALPVAALLTLICSIVGQFALHRAALITSAGAALIWLLYMAGAFTVLEVRCDGNFTCPRHRTHIDARAFPHGSARL